MKEMSVIETAERVLTIARGEIGTTENPKGSNKVKYNTWFYGREVYGASYPWCCVFVCWVFHQAGLDDLLRKTGGCTTLMNWFKAKGRLVPVREARSGDLVFYQFDKDAYADHVGIVEQVSKNGVTAIEGNTSVSSSDNGGAVMRRSRGWGVIMAVARPDYESGEGKEAEMSEKEIRELVAQEVKQAVAKLGETRYKQLEDVPAWARADIGKLAAMGVLKGNERGELDLSDDMVRAMTLMVRLFPLGQEAGEKA